MELEKPTHAGGIILGDGGTVALVHNQRMGTWTFPKGAIEPGETDEEAARREIQEETGLAELEYIDDLGSYERGNGGFDEAPAKMIHLYLFAAPRGATLRSAQEITEARWVPHREAARELTIDRDRAWYASVFERVREAIQRD